MAYYHTYRGSKSLPRKRPKSPVTLVPFRSANPGHLEEFAVSTQHDFANESGAVNTMANGPSQLSPFRTRTMKEYDQQISELKKENFSLKLRIYLMEEKMQQKFSNVDHEDGGYKADIELKVELENLKHELANKQELLLTASKALESLEVQHRSEVQCLKLEAESERNSLKQRIDELEKEKLDKEEHAKHDLTRPSIELLRKAFSIADVTSSDGENLQASETSNLVALLQLRINELETEVIEHTNEKEMYLNTIKTLESTLETKNNCIKIQEQNLLKRMKTIEGFLKIVEDKNEECNHLAKKLQLKTKELKKLKEEMNISAKSEALSSNSDLLRQKQQVEGLNAPMSEQYTNVSTQCDSAVETDAAIDELKSNLCDKDDDLRNIHLDMMEKSGELMRTVEDLDKMKTLVKELEVRMELCNEDKKSLTFHLSRNRDEVLKLQAELKQRDDSIERIKNFLENVMLGNVELQLESVGSDETVAALFQNLLKLGKLLQDVIILSGKEVDNVYFEEQQFADSCDQLHHFDLIRDSHQQKGALSLLSANLNLQKMVESIQSELTESLQKNKFIQEQLNEARQQIDIGNQQIAVSTSFVPTSVDKIIQCPDEVTEKDLKKLGSSELVAENVMEKMRQYLLKMQKLNKSLLQKVDLPQSSSSLQNDNKYQELLTSFSEEINHLLDHVKNLDRFECGEVDGVKNVCEEATLSSDLSDVNSSHSVVDSSLVEAKKEIKRLEFLLSSTEGTVRMLSTKVKYYCNLLRLKGILPLSTNMPSHFSNTNLMNKQFAENECAPLTLTLPANICISKNVSDRSNEELIEGGNHSPLPGSFSAPVTPIKGLPSIVYSFVDTIDLKHLDGLQEEVKMLKQCIQQKDSLLTALQLDIDRYQARSNLCDAACQTLAISFDCQQDNSTEADFQHGPTLKHIAESHHMSELLRIRLEELADFLERLLKFDENGLLDLSGLTAERLASIRECLEKSQELSCTLSQSLIALDNTVLLSGTSNQALAMGPNSQATVSSSNEDDEGDGYATLVSSPVDGLVNKSASAIAQMKSPKSCSRSLQMGHSNSKEQLKSFDNYLLVLRPLNDAAEAKNDSVVAVKDELPTCSLTFGLQGSFLSSTNIGDAPPKKGTEAQHHSLSESDSWSEPDRGVSQQRIGLQSSQLTPNNKLSPRRRDLLTSSSTDSEFVAEFGNSSGRLRYSKGSDKRLSNSQEINLLNQVQELKEINNSLHAELNLYQNLYNSKSGSGPRSSMSTTGKLSRRGRTKSGDSLISSTQVDIKSPNHKLDDYLFEISALRKQLESSIQAYDLLREQFEQQLAFGDSNHEQSKDYDQITSSLYSRLEEYEARLSHKDAELCRIKNEKEHLLAEIQEMSEKFESYQETIESLQSMLEEQQKCSRDACRKVDNLEGLLVERDAALEESNVAHEQLQQAMTKARQLLSDNEGALKHLQEVNEELQNQCHQLKDEIARQHHRQDMVDTLNSHLDELRTNLEASKKKIAAQNEDSAILLTRVEAMEHDLMVKEEEVKDLIQKIDSQNAVYNQELSNHQGLMAKMRMEASHLKVQLEAASTINKTLKTELQMYQKINSIPTNEEMRDNSDRLEKEVPQLMAEIRSLRVQLERSIEANQALRLQLEKKTREPLHLEIGVSDQRCSSVSSPETTSSFSYAQNIVITSDHNLNGPAIIDRQISKSSDYVSDNQKELNDNAHNCISEMVTDSASVYSSPDLGIESDRSRFSSLERSSASSLPKGLGVLQKVEYLEPGFPGGGYWDIVNSAPPRMDGGRQQNCVSEIAKHHNFTYPEYGGNLQDISRLADSGDSTIGFSTRKPYYVTLKEDYGLLKKGMTESLNVLRVIRSKTKQHLLKLRNNTAPVDTSGEYAGWKEAYAGCNALKVLLQESCHLVGQFWMIPLPIIPTCISESNNMSSSKEGNPFEVEIMKLYHELAKEKQRAEDALRQLEASNRLKVGMEKAIIKQLSKTHNVLKQAKGNLQQQQVQSASSLTTHK